MATSSTDIEYREMRNLPGYTNVSIMYVSRDEVPTEAPEGHLYIFSHHIPYDMEEDDYIKKRARLSDECIFIVKSDV